MTQLNIAETLSNESLKSIITSFEYFFNNDEVKQKLREDDTFIHVLIKRDKSDLLQSLDRLHKAILEGLEQDSKKESINEEERQLYEETIKNYINFYDKYVNVIQDAPVRYILQNNPMVNITFKKKDGTIRDMTCTLDPATITSIFGEQPISEDETKFHDNGVISVVDLDKKAWRSIILDNIQTLKVID